jgi:hypothetical protein
VRLLNVLKRQNATFRQRALLPLSLWLTLERGTALVMLLYIISLFSPQGTVLHVLARLLNFRELPLAAGIVGALCAMVLLSGDLTARVYHVCILPMLANAVLCGWAAATNRLRFDATAYTWGSALILFLIWVGFYVAGVKLGGNHDRTA